MRKITRYPAMNICYFWDRTFIESVRGKPPGPDDDDGDGGGDDG